MAVMQLQTRPSMEAVDSATLHRHFLTTPIPIAVTDAQGTIVDVNTAFLEFYGYGKHEVVGQNPRVLKSGRQSPDAYREMWGRITDPDIGYWSGELVNRKRNGDEVTVVLTVSAVRATGGDVTGFVATAVDITRRKMLEAHLLGMNRELEELSRLKSEVMAVTSHDLKSPINAILSRVHLLQEELDAMPPERIRQHLGKVAEAGDRLTRFIGELLDVDKLESGSYELSLERQQIDRLVALCVELNAPAAAARGVELSFTLDGEAHAMVADGAKLEQVFNNLISNAIKFAPPGSDIEVRYREGTAGRRYVTVLDRGPGIPEDDRERIFDRYYQVKKQGGVPRRAFGAGLGLAIVKHVVELHGGVVTVANRSGGGSVFTVELPDQTVGSMGEATVLVFDPLDRIYAQLERPLAERGAARFYVRTLFEARRVLEHEHPDVILVHAASSDAALLSLFRSYAAVRPWPVQIVGIGTAAERDESWPLWLAEPLREAVVRTILDGRESSDASREVSS